LNSLRRIIDRLQRYNQVANIGVIARRYFAMNAFDGVLTIIGVLMGNFTAGVEDARIVVTTGLTTCVAMGISGLWGAYLTEGAERQRELLELEGYTLTMDVPHRHRLGVNLIIRVRCVPRAHIPSEYCHLWV